MELFKAELLKIKKMGIIQLAVLAPLLTIVISINAYSFIKSKSPQITAWQGLFTVSSTIFIGMVLPILIIYITMVMGRIENLNNGWKQLLAMPVKRSKIFMIKYLVVLSAFILALISYLIEYSATAYFFGAKGLIPVEVIIDVLYVFIALQPFIALLFLLSNRFNSVVIPLGVGIVLILSSLLIVQSAYWKYAPWTYALGLVQGGLDVITQVVPLLIVGTFIFVCIFSFDIINFKKKDVI